jgi:hypothetical protein
VLDGGVYLHFVGFDRDHLDTVRLCTSIQGVEHCSPSISGYSGPVRAVYEEWIPIPI